MEKRGVPTVSFATEFFKSLALTVAKGKGFPDLPLVFTPHPLQGKPDAELIEIADELLPQAIKGLTAPVKVGAEAPTHSGAQGGRKDRP